MTFLQGNHQAYALDIGLLVERLLREAGILKIDVPNDVRASLSIQVAGSHRTICTLASWWRR